MLVLYLDTTTGRWYDDNGIELDSSSPKFAFQSRDTLKICAVTATSDSRPLDNDPLSWPRDLQWSGKLAKITVDNDYIHRIKGELTSFITGHVTSITAAIPSAKESMIPSSGNLRVMLSDSQHEVIPYTARAIDDGVCVFDVDYELENEYPAQSIVDCPQSPYLVAEMDIEASDPSVGEFQFDILVDSLRLREEMLYSSTSALSTQGMELLFYRTTASGNEPVRAYLCKTFSIVGTLGDVGDIADLPESHIVDRTHQIISSIIAAGFDVQLSVNGEIWVDYSVGAIPRDILFWRFRFESVAGNWSPAIPLLVGPEGKSAYDVAVENGFDGDVEEWLDSIVGSDGKSAYDVAVENGFDGGVSEWLDSLVGPQGDGLYYDVSGSSATDRGLYDDKPAGFKFAFAEVDRSNRSSTVHIYTKLSDQFADWSDSLTIVLFGALEPSITSVAPVKFSPPPANDGVYYFGIDISANPDAIVAHVTIDTDQGELMLPYWSDLGVRKVLKKDNRLYIYLGDSVQKYNSGKVYLTQMIAAQKTSGDTPDVEGGSMYYGYIEDATLQSVTGITDAMLSGNTITSTPSASVGAVSLGDIPAGSFTVVLVPATSNLKVYKDNGFGGKVNFEVDNGIAGSGANGSKVLIGGSEYFVYGEFNLVDGITTIYID